MGRAEGEVIIALLKAIKEERDMNEFIIIGANEWM